MNDVDHFSYRVEAQVTLKVINLDKTLRSCVVFRGTMCRETTNRALRVITQQSLPKVAFSEMPTKNGKESILTKLR